MTSLQPCIQTHIIVLREQRVLIDADLAELYGVVTKVLVQAVKRNLTRFPPDFMFQLSTQEWGVAMLSSVLGSPRAIGVNIEIMRTFVRVRALAVTHRDLAKRLAELEDKTDAMAMNHDNFSRNTRIQLKQGFDALRALMTPPDPPGRPIGFVPPKD